MSWRLGGSGDGGERAVVFWGGNFFGKLGWDVDWGDFGTTTD